MPTDDLRAQTTCRECRQTDDHPKVHYGVDTFHHDCLPPRVRSEVIDGDPTGVVETVIRECEKGKRGHLLLARIQKLHESEG